MAWLSQPILMDVYRKAVMSSDSKIKRFAAQGLGNQQNFKEALSLLAQLTEDKSSSVRYAAYLAIPHVTGEFSEKIKIIKYRIKKEKNDDNLELLLDIQADLNPHKRLKR